MKIFVDDIPSGVKSITFDISFHNSFDGGHLTTSKNVLFSDQSDLPQSSQVEKVTKIVDPSDIDKPISEEEVPPVPSIENRPQKEIPQEMADMEF